MIKLPAAVPDDDSTFGGTVIVNPGGPGLSGVSYLVEKGTNIQKLLVDIPGTRHYEIVSFDPRGVGRTTPSVDCFRSDQLVRTSFALENQGRGPLDSEKAIGYGLGLMGFQSLRCKEEDALNPDGEAIKFVNTPSVARDMVEMVDKIDELRTREKNNENSEENKTNEKPENNMDVTVARIQYIGWSYGSVLGNYFASMFPGRVGRMVLDGVMDPRDYAAGSGWLSNTQDADKLFAHFWKSCFKTNSYEKCPFLKTDKDWEAAQKRFHKWVNRLDEYPMVVNSSSGGLMALRGEDIRRIVANALYSPLQHFLPLAQALHQGMRESPDQWSQWAALEIPKLGDALRGKGSNVSASGMPQVKDEQGAAVLCGDGSDISNRAIDWWTGHVSQQRKQSKLFGFSWASIRFKCATWPFRANWDFQGPFRTPTHSANLETDRPAAPLLFLSSQLDPVTPFSLAEEAASSHAGSVIVRQKSFGHTAWASAPSKCTWKIVADYLSQGTMPKNGTVCKADCGPWDAKCNAFEVSKNFDVDETAWKAMYGVEQPGRVRRTPLGLE
ncbi:hypothetical protein TGAMA5MH_05889 [Trichoderma gamsii]|uniref:Peptidase S33 tripeptidyl aminopeptidase-like C-terminal domain-containing protein n=1 Tax=Trichoderma gamsii TaxID=398673 RepID=A0A2K0T9K7_9HYPO|nr:hypothetical protein TGAMA5MH_05889 [Trichoderma gamsii]